MRLAMTQLTTNNIDTISIYDSPDLRTALFSEVVDIYKLEFQIQ